MARTGRLHFDFGPKTCEVDIDLHLDDLKAANIHRLIEGDAAESELSIFTKTERKRIIAKGYVRPMIMRLIIAELAR